MSKTLQIAENLAIFTANHERVGDIFAPAVSELCRLAAIEQAATHPVIRPHAEALLQQALKVLVYHTQQTRPIEQTEKMIATLQAHCTPQRAKQEQPRPSAIELQEAEIGIPEPVTELINPA